jgi:hypothetical protein
MLSAIEQALQSDYQHFPKDQSYHLYAEDVYFKDPMTEFCGIERYKQMIQFIDTWFHQPQMKVHGIQRNSNTIRTDWTLSWTTPLPWQPRIHISGWSELTLNEQELIISHIDYWHCSRWDVVKQHFSTRSP